MKRIFSLTLALFTNQIRAVSLQHKAKTQFPEIPFNSTEAANAIVTLLDNGREEVKEALHFTRYQCDSWIVIDNEWVE